MLGAGDVEVGLDRPNMERLFELVKQAASIPPTRNDSWQSAGEAEFSRSDQADMSEAGEDYGTVFIESNGAAARMTIRTKKWDWAPYVATFASEHLDKLSALLSRALHG